MSEALFHRDLNSTTRLLYTPSSFAKLSLFHLQEVGTLQASHPHTSQREYLSSYLFFIVNSGSGTLVYNNTRYSLRVGDCVFIDCRHPYSHTTDDSRWNISWVHFDSPTMSTIYQFYRERGGLPMFPTTNAPMISTFINQIYNIATSASHTRDMELNTTFSQLLTLILSHFRQASTSADQGKRSSMLQIRHYLDNHFQKKITLDDLSERYFINKYYMTRVFKEEFGVSIMDYLITIRITEAKSLLRFSKFNAETIASRCGFSDVYYFSRMFKKVEGIGIREFRKQWGKSISPQNTTSNDSTKP